MGRTVVTLALAALLGAGCTNVCLTVLDSCREPYDAGLGAWTPRDSGVVVVDAGVDAGFAACVKAGCEAACLDVPAPSQVCLHPDCVACQRGDAGAAAFCGRLYPCTPASSSSASPSSSSVGDGGSSSAASSGAAASSSWASSGP